MSVELIRRMLGERLGATIESLPAGAIARLSKARCDALGVGEDDYLKRLAEDAEEMEALIETVVVPETWFFRDAAPFEFLRRFVLTTHPASLRILSLPCATGEEPYSIAAILLQSGMPPSRFRIDAIDVSRHMLDRARTAIYGKGSFREKNLLGCESLFEPCANGTRPVDAVRSAVELIRGNILDHTLLLDRKPYDIIFCRNLLIYLTEEAGARAMSNLDAALRVGGLLFLGYAESRQLFVPEYRSVDFPRAYAAVKPADSPAPRGPVVPVLERKALTELPAAFPSTNPARPDARAIVPSGRTDVGDRLHEARQLADRGQLSAASEICASVLKQEKDCVQAHCIGGLIALAGGDEVRAEQCFQKTLYLDPGNEEALVHIALLLEKRGLGEQAALYRRRLERVRCAACGGKA